VGLRRDVQEGWVNKVKTLSRKQRGGKRKAIQKKLQREQLTKKANKSWITRGGETEREKKKKHSTRGANTCGPVGGGRKKLDPIKGGVGGKSFEYKREAALE